MPADPDQRRRTSKYGARFVIVFAVAILIAGAVLALLIRPDLLGDPERRAIERTRAMNLTRARLNLPLQGTPDLDDLSGRLAAHGVSLGAPVLIRIFKREFEFELWIARDGRYQRFATYPICRWSGWLGPKLAQGDRQAPEGFYTVALDQLNPNSRWHRSFDVGFPNAFDRSHGRTGTALMVHGGCSSAGCFAMTNAVVDEIWKLTTAALGFAAKPGSPPASLKRFQVQIFPFRMSDDNLKVHAGSPHYGFWRQLKAGSDLFEQSQLPPSVATCGGNYRFTAGSSVEPFAVRQSCTTATGPRG